MTSDVDAPRMVWAVVRGTDCSAEIISIYEDLEDARIRAYNEVLHLHQESGLSPSDLELCRADKVRAVEQWNEFWDGDSSMIVNILEAPYFARLSREVTQ